MGDGRLTLITGAAGGIGRALVARFVAAGDTVIAHDRDRAAVEDVATAYARGQILPIASVLPDQDSLTSALAPVIDAHGPIGAAVANAGHAYGPVLETLSAEDWQHDLDTNLTAGFATFRAVLAGLRATRGPIVFVGSVNGLTALGDPGYSVAKAGLIAYAQAIAMEYGPVGIRANVVCPGTVKTPIWQERADAHPEVFDELRRWYPLGDFPTPEDIAEAVWFLASPQARMITGVVLPVDGGLMAGNRVLATDLTQHPF